jgi:protein-L-isoaspartate(D-aspartate) O-methyltransferase
MNDVKETSRQEEMIQRQVVERGITDERVLAALRAVPRDRFFAPDATGDAFADRAAPIGHGQTISQPYMVALMTHRLDMRPEHTVLEVGTGSGYQTAILARLARQVYSVERVKPLLDAAWARLMDMNVRNAHFRYADGTLGWPEKAPFDRVLIAAGAPAVPEKLLLGQLTDGGLAVLPVGPEDEQMLLTVTRRGPKLDVSEVCPCRFVKLIGDEGWAKD